MVVFSAILPHPPIIIPGIGQTNDLGQVKYTISAIKDLYKDFERSQPDTVVIISPHAPIDYSAFGINTSPKLAGNFYDFGLKMNFSFDNDLIMVDSIIEEMDKQTIPLYSHKETLDHGTLVPLYFLTQNIKPKLVSLSYCFDDLENHYAYGQLLGNVLRRSQKKIAIIASGDLSHRLIPGAPAGFNPKGKEFDKKLIGLLESKDDEGIINLKDELIEAAGECGLRSIAILLGVMNRQYDFSELSYEGPFGVGYLVAKL